MKNPGKPNPQGGVSAVITIPPGLQCMADLVAQQNWPRANEDELKRVGNDWTRTGHDLMSLGGDISTAANQIQRGFSGSGADQFRQYMAQLADAPDQLAPVVTQVGQACSSMALNTTTAKLMILAQIIWTAIAVSNLVSSLWGMLAARAVLTGSRLIIMKIAWMLVKAAAYGAIEQGAMDLGVQAIEKFILHDRNSIDWHETLISMEMGAFTGTIGGMMHLSAGKLMPKFTRSVPGHITLGAIDGVMIGEATNLTFGGDQPPGLVLMSGFVGAGFGVLKGRDTHGVDDDSTADMKVPHVEIPEDLGLVSSAPEVSTDPMADVPPPAGWAFGDTTTESAAPSAHAFGGGPHTAPASGQSWFHDCPLAGNRGSTRMSRTIPRARRGWLITATRNGITPVPPRPLSE